MEGWGEFSEIYRAGNPDDSGAFYALDAGEAGVGEDVGGLAGPGGLRSGAWSDPEARAVAQIVRWAEEFAESGFVAGLLTGFGLEQVEEDGFYRGDCGVQLLQPGEEAAGFEAGERGGAGEDARGCRR